VFCPESPPPSDWPSKLCSKLEQARIKRLTWCLFRNLIEKNSAICTQNLLFYVTSMKICIIILTQFLYCMDRNAQFLYFLIDKFYFEFFIKKELNLSTLDFTNYIIPMFRTAKQLTMKNIERRGLRCVALLLSIVNLYAIRMDLL
jgi:hypothetical protein